MSTAQAGRALKLRSRRTRCTKAIAGFSLVELLVVVSILALLIAILVPALRSARGNAQSVVCRANLKNLMSGVLAYAGYNEDIIVPSYNMRGVTGSTANPFDGWGPILDRGGFVSGSNELRNNPFVCPKTIDRAAMPFLGSSTPEDNALGYMDWPAVVTISGSFSLTLPKRGFDKLVRVSYWINGDNPTGLPQSFEPGAYFTGSVGYGPNLGGQIMEHNRFSRVKRPGQLIGLADGFYAGKQEATRPGDQNSRIGYRHRNSRETVNVAFADGHAGSILGEQFPRKPAGDVTLEQSRLENTGSGPTLYADPEHFFDR